MSSSALAASDHLSKVNAFVSTAGNFIDSALDQLDDQLESAMGGMSEKVGEELRGMMPWIGENRLVDKAKN